MCLHTELLNLKIGFDYSTQWLRKNRKTEMLWQILWGWCYCFSPKVKTFIFLFLLLVMIFIEVCIWIQKTPQMCHLKSFILGKVVKWRTAVCILSEIDCFKWKKKVSGNNVQMKNVCSCQHPQCLMSFQKTGLQLPVMALH